ncbi:putative MFS-type transporter YybF [Paenibacillus sp. J31TS4]|uniref:MFS transporter n=1 Tax=Paenibacillus sp. J31TS4 TaxID=2807195 RepID=UPI001B22961D|nr:MFS transporter [Paenibacillus sp. J31TS4]GIP38577.1 putative MFS-type transporter YybF [Paenibacillus sp. J31TS4]
MSYIKQGTALFRRTNIALFAGGFTTFAVLYSTQPLLPVFAQEFGLTPAVASLSLSVVTIALAVSMLLAGSLSEAWGRKPVMLVALFAVSLMTLLTAASPTYPVLLAFRILQGIILSGVPAIAMAYLGEEVEAGSLGVAMGLYISGNSVGGMAGRIVTGTLTDLWGWRTAIVGIGLLGVAASVVFWLLLPPSRHFEPRPLKLLPLVRSLASLCRDVRLLCLYGVGFLLMGSFVTLYNYIGFQLLAPPYSLSQTLVGWIFLVYIVGTFSSAWMGKQADRHGRPRVLAIALLLLFAGACLTLETDLLLKLAGIAVFTFGFFGGHSIASGWVGRLADHDKAQASSLYLFFYYAGSSVGGTAGGSLWSAFGWHGIVAMIACFLFAALLLSLRLTVLTRRAETAPREI